MVRKEIKVIEILELFIMFLPVKHTNLNLCSYSKNSCFIPHDSFMKPHPSLVTPLCSPHDMLVYPLEPFKLRSFLSRRGLLMSRPNLMLLT